MYHQERQSVDPRQAACLQAMCCRAASSSSGPPGGSSASSGMRPSVLICHALLAEHRLQSMLSSGNMQVMSGGRFHGLGQYAIF